MSFFDTQNPGIGGIDELTPAEEAFLTSFAGLSYANGDILYYNSGLQRLPKGTDGHILTLASGLPSWAAAPAGYTDEQAQDAVGTILTDSSTIDFTYTDATPEITAVVIDDSISNTKLANMATQTFKGRTTAGTGDPEDLTVAQAKTLLNLTGTNSGDVTLAGSPNYITISGQTITRALINLASHVTGDLPFANLTQIAGLSVLGRSANTTGDVAAITASSDLQVLRRSGTSIGFGSIDLSSSNAVTGTLAIANGGTGSATQNFVDLTTAQDVAGVKTLTSNLSIKANVTVNEVSRPSSAPTLTEITSGSNLFTGGTYKYRYTFVTANGETEPSESTTISLAQAASDVQVGIAVSADTRVTARKIYRTADGQNGFYLVATVNNNSATTYVDANGSQTTVMQWDNSTSGKFSNGIKVYTADYTKPAIFISPDRNLTTENPEQDGFSLIAFGTDSFDFGANANYAQLWWGGFDLGSGQVELTDKTRTNFLNLKVGGLAASSLTINNTIAATTFSASSGSAASPAYALGSAGLYPITDSSAQPSIGLSAIGVNLAKFGFYGVGMGRETRLNKLSVKASADIQIGGTTTANSTTTISASGSTFSTVLGIGDRISLSSAASTYATITAISSDTSLTVSSALGDGTSQNINKKQAPFRAENSSEHVKFLVDDRGRVYIQGEHTSTFSEPQASLHVASGAISGNMDTMTYAATISLDTTKGNVHKTTTVNATGNATINASSGGVAGQHMWIIITNDATSGKVITFGTNFLSTGTITGTVSKSATIQFISDGTSWYEVSRTLGL